MVIRPGSAVRIPLCHGRGASTRGGHALICVPVLVLMYPCEAKLETLEPLDILHAPEILFDEQRLGRNSGVKKVTVSWRFAVPPPLRRYLH